MIKSLTISRRSLVASLGGLALAQTLPGCEAWSDQPVSISWPGYEPMFLTHRENGLDPNRVHGAQPELLISVRKLSSIMINNGLLKQNNPPTSLIRADFFTR